MSSSPFQQRTLIVLYLVGGLSLLALLYSAAFDQTPAASVRPQANSRSALGHSVLVALLQEQQVPFLVSRHDSVGRAGRDALLVLAEPRTGDDQHSRLARLGDILQRSRRVLLVLPKRTGSEDPGRAGWIDRHQALSRLDVQTLLQECGVDGEVVRVSGAATGWATHPSAGDLAPTLSDPQLVTSRHLKSIVSSDQGILLGATRNDRLWVLSDPDVIANHGIVQGRNAELAMAALDLARGDRRSIVLDETLHGPPELQHFLGRLLRFPLVLVTANVVLVTLLLLWVATGRFGAPQPAPSELVPGKQALIGNTAALLRQGGHTTHLLRRYFERTLEELQVALHRTGEPDLQWLEEACRRRGARDGVLDLRREVLEPNRPGTEPDLHALRVARRIHRMKQELLHGP